MCNKISFTFSMNASTSNGFFTLMYLKNLLILSLILAAYSSAHQNLNSYDDYDEQGNYNNQHPLEFYSSHSRDDSYDKQMSYQPRNYDENMSYGNYGSASDPRQNEPRVYEPHPVQPPPPPQDPNVNIVPRLGMVRGISNFKIINNRPISAYFGLKYGQVQNGLGRFQVSPVHSNTENEL